MQSSISEVNHTADLDNGGSWRQGAGLLEKMIDIVIQRDRETGNEKRSLTPVEQDSRSGEEISAEHAEQDSRTERHKTAGAFLDCYYYYTFCRIICMYIYDSIPTPN
jgi:hypothetical protein